MCSLNYLLTYLLKNYCYDEYYLWFGISSDDTLKASMVALQYCPVFKRLYKERFDRSSSASSHRGRVNSGHFNE